MSYWKSISRRPALGVLAIVGVQAAASGAYRLIEGRRSSPLTEGDFEVEPLNRQAPDLTLVHADGSALRLSQLKGKVVVLHFWATWCEPCARELPALLTFAEQMAPMGVTLLALSLDTSWENVATFFKGEIPREVVRGTTGEEAEAYNVTPIPQTFFINSSGEVVLRARGARDWTRRAAARTVLALR
ncbi:MAG: TlpA disulfide reductase family protein [Polyangiaceae bacterium]|nr:TlpA disulfide reductase family protein [Polyangiaceae bacterium]